MDISERESPFQPGRPVSPDKFKGREDIIKEIIKYFYSIVNGNPHHFFITGKRGIGKTSLANFISDYGKNNHAMVTVHIVNDGVHTVDELIIQIMERIFNEIRSEKWSKQILDYFKDHIESVGIGGFNLKFNPSQVELKNLKDNFAFNLVDLVSNFKDKDGIFIVIDDINGLSETPEFANWYKSFADTLSTSYDNEAPIGIMLTGYPEKYMKLYEQNPSLSRIFHVQELEGLSYDEIISFYNDIFESNEIHFVYDSLELMTEYCSGMPTMMQEIGDATFWKDIDNCISIGDAFEGIIEAGNRIGLKYLQPVLDKKIRSPHYMSIFKKIGENLAASQDSTFTKKEYEDVLDESEIKVFKDFISRAKELGIIELTSSKRQGVYKFTNNLYPIYFYIQSIKDKNQTELI